MSAESSTPAWYTGGDAQNAGAPDRPMIVANDQVVSMYFDARGVQSMMLRDDPWALALGYTRTMMGFLLFQPAPRRVSIIGLGGGSLAKYCYRHLPGSVIEAVEINPEVIALRDVFRLPRADARFIVRCADGADHVREPGPPIDVLLVDGFEADGMPARLGTRGFYADCRRRLGDEGVLVANLVTDEPDFHRYLRALRSVFGRNVALAPAQASDYNVTVFAWKGARTLPREDDMRARLRLLAPLHRVNLLATAAALERGRHFDWSRYEPAG